MLGSISANYGSISRIFKNKSAGKFTHCSNQPLIWCYRAKLIYKHVHFLKQISKWIKNNIVGYFRRQNLNIKQNCTAYGIIVRLKRTLGNLDTPCKPNQMNQKHSIQMLNHNDCISIQCRLFHSFECEWPKSRWTVPHSSRQRTLCTRRSFWEPKNLNLKCICQLKWIKYYAKRYQMFPYRYVSSNST